MTIQDKDLLLVGSDKEVKIINIAGEWYFEYPSTESGNVKLKRIIFS